MYEKEMYVALTFDEKYDEDRKRLSAYLQTGITTVQLFAKTHGRNKACDNCQKENGKFMSTEDAINAMTLPNIRCEKYEGCKCIYLPVLDQFKPKES